MFESRYQLKQTIIDLSFFLTVFAHKGLRFSVHMQEELPRVEDSDYGSKGQTESHVAVTTLFLISVFQNASVWVSSP